MAGGFTTNQYVTTSGTESLPSSDGPSNSCVSRFRERARPGRDLAATTGQITSSQTPARRRNLVDVHHEPDRRRCNPSTSRGRGSARGDAVLRRRPGCPGYFQVNFQVPAGVTPAHRCRSATYLGRSSNAVSSPLVMNGFPESHFCLIAATKTGSTDRAALSVRHGLDSIFKYMLGLLHAGTSMSYIAIMNRPSVQLVR